MLETNYKIAENIFIGLTIEGLRTTYPEEMHQIALHNQTTTDLYYLRNLFNDPKNPIRWVIAVSSSTLQTVPNTNDSSFQRAKKIYDAYAPQWLPDSFDPSQRQIYYEFSLDNVKHPIKFDQMSPKVSTETIAKLLIFSEIEPICLQTLSYDPENTETIAYFKLVLIFIIVKKRLQNNQTALNEETITKEIRQLVEHDDNVDNLPESIKTTLRKAIATGIDDICLKIKDVLHDILGKQLYASLKENIYKHIHPTNWEQIEKETTTPISKRIEKKEREKSIVSSIFSKPTKSRINIKTLTLTKALNKIKLILSKKQGLSFFDIFKIKLILLSVKNQIWMYQHDNNDAVRDNSGPKSVRETILTPLEFANNLLEKCPEETYFSFLQYDPNISSAEWSTKFLSTRNTVVSNADFSNTKEKLQWLASAKMNRTKEVLKKKLRNSTKSTFEWADLITDGIMLGQIPSSEEEKKKLIKYFDSLGKSLKLVISVVEDKEANNTLNTESWAKDSISQIIVNAKDYTANFDNAMQQAFDAIDHTFHHWKKKHGIYFHCKAGKGRSPVMLAAFMALFLLPHDIPVKLRVKQSYQMIKKIRTQIEDSPNHINSATAIASMYILHRKEKISRQKEEGSFVPSNGPYRASVIENENNSALTNKSTTDNDVQQSLTDYQEESMFIDDETGNVLITFSSKQSFESFVEYLKYVNDPRFDSEKIIGRSKYNDNKDSITSYWLSLSPAEYNIIWENENAYDELTGKSNQIIQFQ